MRGITCHDLFEKVRFYNTQETLGKVKEIISMQKKGAWLRFGDGDINIANGLNDMHQKTSLKFQQEMREALAMNGPTILKTLSLHCEALGWKEEGMYPGNQEVDLPWCINHFTKAIPFWGEEIRDVYSPVALCFSATSYPDRCIEFLSFLKKQNVCLLVGNENIPVLLRTILFGEGCQFVSTPARFSYQQIDRIEMECLQKVPEDTSYKVIIIAMGCAGRALQKRLWHKLGHVFFLDFGSLMDALCGWNTRAYMELTNFSAEYFLKQLLLD